MGRFTERGDGRNFVYAIDTKMETSEYTTKTLITLRKVKGIKQSKLAGLLEVTPCNYSKKEKGDIRFSISEAYQLAKYFNCSIEELFFSTLRQLA